MRHLDVEPRGEVFFFFGKTTTPEHQISLLLLLIFFFLFFFGLRKLANIDWETLRKTGFFPGKQAQLKIHRRHATSLFFVVLVFPSMPRFSSPPHKSIGALLGQVLMWKQSSRWGYSKMCLWLCVQAASVWFTHSPNPVNRKAGCQSMKNKQTASSPE